MLRMDREQKDLDTEVCQVSVLRLFIARGAGVGLHRTRFQQLMLRVQFVQEGLLMLAIWEGETGL